MGLLTDGEPLGWEESKKHFEDVKRHGIQQFINLYHQKKDRSHDNLKWGDEVEYILVHFDHDAKKVRLLLAAPDLLRILHKREELAIATGTEDKLIALWRPEYAAFQIEASPGKPYSSFMTSLEEMETNMKVRRDEVQRLLPPDCDLLMFTCFPQIGCPDFLSPEVPLTNEVTGSVFFPDQAIFPDHARFRTVTKNTLVRRHSRQLFNLPLFIDERTPRPFIESIPAPPENSDGHGHPGFDPLPDHIFCDSMGQGSSCCCLQVTFQACNLDEARQLYDQLATFCPIMLALTAATPIHRGYLAATDTRWQAISEASDDRTLEERGLAPLKNQKLQIPNSRYDSVDCYLSLPGMPFNDVPVVYHEEHYDMMIRAGVDRVLAQHVAHLFVRDPLILLRGKLDEDDETETDNFENINSTVWQSMRLKLPSYNTDMGWRVEFRPMELQVTDFENAAFATFIVLITRLILTFDLDFLVPMSKVHANMKESAKLNAAVDGRFFFRTNVVPEPQYATRRRSFVQRLWDKFLKKDSRNEDGTYLSLDEIFNGAPEGFPGLIPLISEFIHELDLDAHTMTKLQLYLEFISKKASGEIPTTATWIRQFVRSHPTYKFDSVVNDEIVYDLMNLCSQKLEGVDVPGGVGEKLSYCGFQIANRGCG